jgi:rod shape-determining protein MreC
MNVYLKKQNFRWQKIMIGVVMLFFFIGVLNFFQKPIRNSFYVLISPISKTFWRAGDSASGFFTSLLNAKGLTQENSNLQQENQRLSSEVSALQETINEDQAIKEVAQNTQADNVTLAPAQTIGLDTANDVMVINKGSQDGISENMPVISSQKVLYGKVSKVYKNFSNITLISDKNSVVDAKVQSSDTTKPPIFGAIKGNGNFSIYLDLVAQDATINQGDVVVTSALEGIFPKDLLIGKITHINKNDSKPFQTAAIQPFFNVNAADNVFIITNYKQTK